MLRYTIERLLYVFLALFLILVITFFLIRLLPGSPFNDEKLDKEQIRVLNEKYGLDQPMPIQFLNYMKGALSFDFGKSFDYDNKDVMKDLILPRLPRTIKVGVLALGLGIFFGILLGSISALKRGGFLDSVIVVLTVLGTSVPSFVFAVFMQYILCIKLRLFPVLYDDSIASSIIVPALSLSIYSCSTLARFTRSEVLEILNSDFILFAKAKGIGTFQVVVRHTLKNAMIPIITFLGPMILSTMVGGVVMESIFGIPGIGDLMVRSILENDYFTTMGVTFLYSFIFMIIVLITDLLYGALDPRVRMTGAR